ncbi:bifunctional glutamate N-acetyltransferase/amino-acid acetyltransferase ArgJ [Psychrobacter sp. I-STPA6b]|uniref:bifunctional glutamate N-acetyltransferase/amino-acid acetyltransferase ArgJ n=1 Tax=Psychrobacter sp. I-STPA6b TaxID=2585718 RepID=UPI001D0CD3E7|nr:bifunctional glutamate N-acetyltransferase/amino-acid acetyltransferase ArgJ [Psychrobacter sp. I-STPA6b]
MAVGNVAIPETIFEIQGVRIGVTSAGVRYKNRDDLVVFELVEGTKSAVVTTQSGFCAAPVQVVREHSQQADSRYLIINTGNANAGTGELGLKSAYETCQAVADKMGIAPQAVWPFSTGVIGEPLRHQAIIAGLDDIVADFKTDNWVRAAKGICTTDTVPKLDSVQVVTEDGTTYHITGISKGAGMIRPNMATMLGFVATDANIEQQLLQQMLNELTEQSFNRITVDGDTSTNDCCVLMATAQVSQTVIDSVQHPHYQVLFEALKKVFLRLAHLIVRDGEGATKFITVTVAGGRTQQECCDVAYAVAHSPLVKTACFASDPNWGRLLAAIGYAGVADLQQHLVSVKLNEVSICERGQIAPDYTEEQGQVAMSRPEIVIEIDLGRGDYTDTVYTCDLSYEYIKINADYRS